MTVMQNNQLSATIFNIQPMSTEDGPGIRSTVFMKGCPLRCLWCQNPEGLSTQPLLIHEPLRCIGCNSCLDNCPQGALSKGERGLIFGSSCLRCLRCADNCPARAIRVFGEQIELDVLLKRLIRDKPFYKHSGGGVTFSGGECLLQHTFLKAAIPLLKSQDIHVCLDTAGCASPEIFQSVAREADLVLYDLKIIDEEKHRQFTGLSNVQILENVVWLGSSGVPFWIRVPVVPGYTDSEKDIAEMANFIKNHLGSVERIDLLGYNDLCTADYERMGLAYKLKDLPRIEKSAMLRLREIMLTSGAGQVTISNYT
ncbi:MAG: glycyl-radical enzyme activating protein [Firmicutes bacterium]|nr:glycyl-radical enzyme activating protein [Bacillota bacterium]